MFLSVLNDLIGDLTVGYDSSHFLINSNGEVILHEGVPFEGVNVTNNLDIGHLEPIEFTN